MKKVLYFEGAGWEEADSSKETIGNCRIRTAFTNLEGKKIYLEMGTKPINDKKGKATGKYGINVDFMFYITEDKDIDDCNNSRIKYNRGKLNKYNYTAKDITKVVNKFCNTEYKTIKVLPQLSGYRVHAENRKYNLVDNFEYDKNLIEKREEIKKHFYNLEKAQGKKYPNFSLWVDEEKENTLHLLRHFNGYNKHWIINIDAKDWKKTVTETKLNKYAC